MKQPTKAEIQASIDKEQRDKDNPKRIFSKKKEIGIALLTLLLGLALFIFVI